MQIPHLKEVSHTGEIAVFPSIWNSDVFDLSHHSAGIRIWDIPPFFVATNWSVRIYRVSAQMCYVSLKLNLSGKIQVLKYWLTDTYSKCIIWGHSIITLLQNDQNLGTPSTFIGCTCLILVLYIDSHLF